MTISSKTKLGKKGLSHKVVFDPGDTLVKVAKGATDNFLSLCAAPFKGLIWLVERGGQAVKVDEDAQRYRRGNS